MNQNDQLEQMTTTLVGQVESVTKYEIDSDSKGGSLWVSKDTSGRNANVLGREIIKIRIPFEMFSQIKDRQEQGEFKLPCKMEIFASIDMGGGNRANLTAISVRKYLEPTEQNQPVIKPENIDKTTGEIKTGEKK